MKKELIRFLLFTCIVTLFLGVCFTSADFFAIPVAGVKDFLVIAAQWAMVMVALGPCIECQDRYGFPIMYSMPLVLACLSFLLGQKQARRAKE